MSELYIYHHGIQGQKWGIRRFQNTDGTLTEEGKRRYESYQKNNAKDISRVIRNEIIGAGSVGYGYERIARERTARKSSALNEAAKAISDKAKKKELEQIKQRDDRLKELYKEFNSLKNTFRFGSNAQRAREYDDLKQSQIKQIADIIKREKIAEDLMGKYKDETVLGWTREERLSGLLADYGDIIFKEDNKKK